MATVNQDFQPAPMGRRVVMTTTFSFVFVTLAVVVDLIVALGVSPGRLAAGPRIVMIGAPLLTLAVLFPVYLWGRAQVARLQILDNCLVVSRKRYPLAGLQGVERDPDILRWAAKIYGNGGLGSIRGRFWSKRVGKFEAFLTGTENAVVLRWPDRVVAVSPADPEFFIRSARSAGGLK